MESFLSPNFTYLSSDGRLSRIEFQTMLKAWFQGTTSIEYQSLRVTEEDDRVVDEIQFSFDMGDQVAFGRYCTVGIFEDGLLYELRTYGGVTLNKNSRR